MIPIVIFFTIAVVVFITVSLASGKRNNRNNSGRKDNGTDNFWYRPGNTYRPGGDGMPPYGPSDTPNRGAPPAPGSFAPGNSASGQRYDPYGEFKNASEWRSDEGKTEIEILSGAVKPVKLLWSAEYEEELEQDEEEEEEFEELEEEEEEILSDLTRDDENGFYKELEEELSGSPEEAAERKRTLKENVAAAASKIEYMPETNRAVYKAPEMTPVQNSLPQNKTVAAECPVPVKNAAAPVINKVHAPATVSGKETEHKASAVKGMSELEEIEFEAGIERGNLDILQGSGDMETGRVISVSSVSGNYCRVSFEIKNFDGTFIRNALTRKDDKFAPGSAHYILLDPKDKERCTVL